MHGSISRDGQAQGQIIICLTSTATGPGRLRQKRSSDWHSITNSCLISMPIFMKWDLNQHSFLHPAQSHGTMSLHHGRMNFINLWEKQMQIFLMRNTNSILQKRVSIFSIQVTEIPGLSSMAPWVLHLNNREAEYPASPINLNRMIH